jgi:hypothetical protein
MLANSFNRIRSLLLVIFVMISAGLMAQPGDPGGDPDVPIDGGIGLLIAAGALYGSKKMLDYRKKK